MALNNYSQLENNWEDWKDDDVVYTYLSYGYSVDDESFTKKDLIDICKGNVKLAEHLYYALDGYSPHTHIEEWIREGEIDEDCNFIYKDN